MVPFALTAEDLGHAYTILADYGNMSSASVLFVLERFLAHQPPTGDYGVMLALGLGFSAEKVLFHW
jgi:alkylresorcinol/alkylpyrone synthase